MVNVLFRIIGGMALFYSCALLFAGILVPRFSTFRASIKSYGLLLAFAILIAALGVGLLYLRKWAAIGLSLLMLYPAFWCVSAAVHPIPGNANWLGMLFALVLVSPSILTIKHWHALEWRSGERTGT
jgi:hypothetical protein